MEKKKTRLSPFLVDYQTRDDALHFSDFRPTLRDILLQADSPLTVGVFGPWGSGKTSLLSMLRKDIEAKGSPDVRTVWITAWKYDRHEALWRAFILRVLDALWPRKEENKPRDERPRFSESELTDERQKDLVRQLAHLEESVYRPVDWQELGHWTVNWWQAIREGGKAAAEIAAAFLPGAILFKQALEVLGRDKIADEELAQAAQAFQRQVKSYHREQLVHMEQFEKTFAEALKLAEIERLVIFVDDLDRCLPEKAIEVLEAIKLFLEVPGTIFVLGMDKVVLERGIETRYREWFQAKGTEGERLELPVSGEAYLHKMVQIPFNLPPLGLSDVSAYIDRLEKDLPGKDQISEMSRSVMAHGLYPNPRQVKRALNIFRLLKGLVLEREKRPVEEGGLMPGKIAWPLLAKAILIQHQWPELYRDWQQYPTLVRSLEEAYAREPVSEERIVLGEATEVVPESTESSQPRDASEVTLQAGETTERASQPAFMRGIRPRGLLEPYLTDRRKYALLERLLTYPSEDQVGEGQERARFVGLGRAELEAYLFLVSVTEVSKPRIEVVLSHVPILSGLLSTDPARQQDALAQFEQIEPDTRKQEQRSTLQGYLVPEMHSTQKVPLDRVTAADALDALGWLPDDLYQFVSIPAQTQTNASQSSHLSPFWIGKYPVTNVQYRHFLEADDFADPELWRGFPKFNENSRPMSGDWGEEGWKWLQANWDEAKKVYPRYWQVPRFGIAGRGVPVVGITWYEVNAFCRWLLKHWGDPDLPYRQATPGLKPGLIRLPTEAEWALAAGGEQPEGRYPWNMPSETTQEVEEIVRRANVGESNIGRTTPVGMFPLGASDPYGLRELAGNVWEWQANYSDKDHDFLALRGGSWSDSHGFARVVRRYLNRPGGRWSGYGFRLLALPS